MHTERAKKTEREGEKAIDSNVISVIKKTKYQKIVQMKKQLKNLNPNFTVADLTNF